MRRIDSRFYIMLSIAVLGVLAACIQRKPERLAMKESPVSTQLSEMVEARRVMLANPDIDSNLYAQTMIAFRYRVYDLVSQALIRQPEDLYSAAILLQYSQDVSDAECLLLSHYLARQAAQKDHEDAKRLAAESLDRYLTCKGLPQKYGTQYVKDSLGRAILAPIDPNTTDSERVAWGVPPLESLTQPDSTISP